MFFTARILMAVLVSGFTISAAATTTDTTQELTAVFDKTQSLLNQFSDARRPEQWQLRGGFGLGVPFVTASENQTKLESHSGIGLPLNFIIGVYHPNSSGGRGHFGYTIDITTYSKRNLNLIGNDSVSFSQGTVGGSYLFYLTDNREYFIRSTIGLSGITYQEETPTAQGNSTKNSEYSNGLGLLFEVGGTIKSDSFSRLFTYSGLVSSSTASNPTLGHVRALYLSANVGVLW
ncbi:hypothetical protein D3C87_256940 [compost metagenome]